MKKYLLIALAAVAACMVSCSKDPKDSKEEPWKIIENGFAGYSVKDPFYCVSYDGAELKDCNIELFLKTNDPLESNFCIELPALDLGKTIDLSKPCDYNDSHWGYYISFNIIEGYYSTYWAEYGPYTDGTGKCMVEYLDGPYVISADGESATPKEGAISTDAKFKIDFSYSDTILEAKFSDTVTASDYTQEDYKDKDMNLKGSLKLHDMYFNNANYYPDGLEDGYLGIRLPNNKYCGIELWVDKTLIGEKIDLSKTNEIYCYVGIYSESVYNNYWLDFAYYRSFDETATGTMQLDYVDGPYELVDGAYKLKAGHKEDESAKIRVSLDYKTCYGVFSINKEYTAEAIVE